jgi:iron-sulfur cluster repair protein YtfE (RIC family)
VYLSGCSVLAHRLLEGEAVAGDLDEALAQLGHAVMEHNATEMKLVCPLLENLHGWGGPLVNRMLEEHQAEHAAFWDMLAGSGTEIASRMEDLVDELDEHMTAEERMFLSPLVFREDVIATADRSRHE